MVGALAAALVDSDPYWPPDGGEPFYQEDASYERTDDAFQGHGWLWEAFRRTIVYEQRFFNDAAKELLSEIFDGIHRQRDVGRRQPVVVIEPGAPEARFIRARLAEDATTRKDISADPVRQMGPPPQRKRKPGRMNPSGVGAFYAAYDLTTCIAELRPRVGSVVASAEFEIVRPVVALDMTRFAGEPKEPNKFAKDHVKRMAQWRFMQSFMHEIAQPISPDDEHLDYIPTQAVGEYLLRHHRFHLNGVERRIEAIVFRSAQHPAGKNIVLLGDAAVVEAAPSIDGERQTGLGSAFDTLLAQSGPPPFGRLRYRENSLALYRIDEASFRSSRFHEALDFEDF